MGSGWSCTGLVLILLSMAVGAPRARNQAPRPAVPVDPIPALLDAFGSHQIVAFSAGRSHSDAQAEALIGALVSHPRFAETVDDLVLECCSARYQTLIDQFVGAADVREESLADTWRNTTQVNANQRDCPGCLAFFRTVRAANASAPRERRLRILFGEPPIDWSAVHTKADHTRWLAMRDTFPADLIRREVLARHRRALVIYGGMHLQRKNLLANYETAGLAETLVSRLEKTTATKVFTVWAAAEADKLQVDVATWPVPSLAMLRGTVLGTADFAVYYPFATRRISMRNGTPDFSHPIPRDRWRSLRMEDQFDAVVYLGPQSTMGPAPGLSPDMCSNTGYMKMLRERMALVGLQPEIDRLEAYCARASK